VGARARLVALACLAEATTGLFVLVEPALFVRLLLGVELASAGLAVARLAGIALLTLAAACWPSRNMPTGRTAGLRAILLYNAVVTPYLALLGVSGLAGWLLWPAVGVHALLAVLLALAWQRAA
jgi:hypothetical protein